MQPFTYLRSQTPAAAHAASNLQSVFFAGGTTLVDLLKLNVIAPSQLVDINGLPFSAIEDNSTYVTIGANVRNTTVANHPAIRQHFPALSEAILSGASAQIRNMASTAGNIMQRTRCEYFRDASAKCNKRTPGAGCDAMLGFNRGNAVLGTSDQCIATHPSDMCVALAIFDAEIETLRPNNVTRRIPFADFHLLPGATPHRETLLEKGELITQIHLPVTPLSGHSLYRKVRDRASYEFALASAAVALIVENGKISQARVALGGIASKPWRSHEAESALIGKQATTATFRAAAGAALSGAKPQTHNAFKIELAQRTIVLALEDLL